MNQASSSLEWLIVDKDRHGEKNTLTLLSQKAIGQPKMYDNVELTNTVVGRNEFGNSLFIYSNIKTWLNSEGLKDAWWTSQHSADAPPPYINEDGFLSEFTNSEKNSIVPVTIKSRKSYPDMCLDPTSSHTYTREKVYLPSLSELGAFDEGIMNNEVKGTFAWKAVGAKKLLSTTTGNGNILKFDGLMANYTIGNTSNKKENVILWNKIETPDGKLLLISDRVLLYNMSINNLNDAGYITGTNVTIDGVEYNCRVLSGGLNARTGGELGGSLPNEWDLYISNENEYTTLPAKPTAADNDNVITNDDVVSVHNRIWNWYAMNSLCSDLSYRGNTGKGYTKISQTTTGVNIGWRPVLEIVNYNPNPTILTPTYRGKVGLGTLLYKGKELPIPSKPWSNSTSVSFADMNM
jgi:hypothetical protein